MYRNVKTKLLRSYDGGLWGEKGVKDRGVPKLGWCGDTECQMA